MFQSLLQNLRALTFDDFTANGAMTRFVMVKQDIPATIAIVGAMKEIMPRIDRNLRADHDREKYRQVTVTVPRLTGKPQLANEPVDASWDSRVVKGA